MTRARFDFYGPPRCLSKWVWTISVEVFYTSPSAYVSHFKAAYSTDSPVNFKFTSISHLKKEKKKKIYFEQERGRERKTECRGRAWESQRVKPKYYYTCYNSLLFQWQGSWSEGDFITLQVIASYIKLGRPQFLGSRSVWLTVKLTALHHRVIRLACWLCIKQEQTERAALLRLPAGTRTVI